MSGPLTVREALTHLTRWGAVLFAGERGLSRTVHWASVTRAQLPAFQHLQRGELAIFSVATVQALQDRGAPISLEVVLDQIVELGASGAVIAGLTPTTAAPRQAANAARELRARADRLALPIIALPPQAPLADVRASINALITERREGESAPLEPMDAYAVQVRAGLRSEALEALLAGAYVSEAQMRLRASHLGYDLNQPHVVLWVQTDTAERQSHRDSAAADPARALAEALEVSLGAWTQVREPDEVIALLPLEPGRSLQELAERVATQLTRTLGDAHARRASAWSAGLGDPVSAPAQVRRSAQEAHAAAQLGATLLGARHVARPSDLGVYRLLLALREQGELESFTRRALEPLQRDPHHGDVMIETLEAYFACNGNGARTAKKLNLHRNTLLFRLGKAQRLLGQNLDDPEVRLTLQLAIKGQRVLRLDEEHAATERG